MRLSLIRFLTASMRDLRDGSIACCPKSFLAICVFIAFVGGVRQVADIGGALGWASLRKGQALSKVREHGPYGRSSLHGGQTHQRVARFVRRA